MTSEGGADNGQVAVVPFGKYKGQPVEVLMADAGYRDWAMGQPWFRDQYPAIYQVIINYGAAPADTPEHNAMQAGFLDDGLCLRLCERLWGTSLEPLPDYLEEVRDMLDVSELPRVIEHRLFEDEGWDVRFGVDEASFEIDCTAQMPACMCRCADALHEHDPACPWSRRPSLVTVARLMNGTYRRDWGPAIGFPLVIRRGAHKGVEVELKPDLGDDFPAVLRQVLKRDHHPWGRQCVVVRRAQFEQVTWDQVVKMFAASGITLLRESDLAVEAPR